MNYTVFDVETANSQRDSICAIGVIRYENNRVVYEKEMLINPETEFNYFNTRIHGITARDVANAPTFPEVWKELEVYFKDTILVAHNAKSMDLCALYRTLERYNLPLVTNSYICTMELAKKVFKKEESVQTYRLDALAKKYGVELFHHHNALDDTKACFEIFKRLEAEYPKEIKPMPYLYGNVGKSVCCGEAFEGMYSEKTKAMQKLQQIVIEVIADDNISDFEICELRTWLEAHEELKGVYPFDKIFETVENVMLDGVMDESEKQILLQLFDAFIHPQTVKTDIEFAGKSVCLSGEFNFGSKRQVEDFLTAKGAVIAKAVTGKLDILILGEAGNAAWKYGNYGAKYEKACQLNEKGKGIVIVKERDVII